MTDIQKLENIIPQVRRDIVRMVHANNSGHPGGSLGCTEFMIALYFEVMNHNTEFSMDGIGEDIFFLSNGHISPVWYSVLSRSGYFSVSELATFRKLNSRLQGHPATHEGLEGIRIASGSLGQGLSVALGTCQSKKLNNDNSIVYTLHGDGELQEGQNWEAIMYASGNKIDNIIATVDYNQKQIDGSLEEVLSMGDLKDKFEAFGWIVFEEERGNDIASILNVLNAAKAETKKEKPIVILLYTEMGNGVDYMMGTHKWHGSAPNDEQLEIALNQNEETLGDY
ncbi:MAG: transketolase [Flavobacteriales bacterium]|jgi:transketolase|nr:transketolase [Flavobacteriales bacterium]MBT5353667.1 transketolase [Flavobacteriales bacterium]MBT6815066.1 transketolase [Flavobacteriales bacterium]MBT7725976.1 transketolase [Flavobacteriales bacterium]